MKILLDANVLIALAITSHEFHARVDAWFRTLDPKTDTVFTCAITELAFVRIVPQLPGSNVSVAQAALALERLKAAARPPIQLLADDVGAAALPAWASVPKKTTDGHLVQLAANAGASLATCDAGIPGALLVRSVKSEA